MFESSEVREPRRGLSFWLTAAFIVLLILFVVNLVRVNQRPVQTGAPKPIVEEHFEGTIANERTVIEPGETLPFRVHFNYRSTIKGNFRTGSNDQRVLFIILDEGNYEAWARGGEYKTLVSTGKAPAANVSRVLEDGTYFLIFDNRGSEKTVVVDIDLRAE
jgi:hypothetical protein